MVLCETFNAKAYFDIVVLDLNMPIADGYETCSKILNLFGAGIFKNENPIINLSNYKPVMVACSSYVSDYVEEETKKVGFNIAIEAPLTIL